MLSPHGTQKQEKGLGPHGQANAGCCWPRVPRDDHARRSSGCRSTVPDRRQCGGRGACRPSRRTRPRRCRGRRQHLVLRPHRPVWADDGPAAYRLRSGRCRPAARGRAGLLPRARARPCRRSACLGGHRLGRPDAGRLARPGTGAGAQRGRVSRPDRAVPHRRSASISPPAACRRGWASPGPPWPSASPASFFSSRWAMC